ncbi:MAG: efflux RND transporter periplasmic adaptor subunit [Proteobacteria bacterium]|nr:efflux RND transporter periplasmic adaptor subunit [Pseudomonadota bacterium]
MQEKLNGQGDIAKVLGIKQQPGNKIFKLWVIATALIIVMGGVILKSTAKPAPVQYKTQAVEQGDITITVTATGTLQPTNRVDVGSELSGIIKNVAVDYNDRVKAGQPLAVLNTSKIEAQVKQSRAGLEAAQAKVRQAQATLEETTDKLTQYEKVRKLSNNKVPSYSEIKTAQAACERAKADLGSAKAQVSQAQATLEADQTDLSKAVIRSPIEGVILTRSAEPGQTVAASFQSPVLFSLAEDLTQMELHVNVDEADVGKIQEGQEATFTVSAYPNRKFEARITKTYYGSSTTSGVVTYETILKVANTDLSLRPGMTATANIKVEEVKDALLVPTAALRFIPDVKETTEKKSSKGLVGSLFQPPPERSSTQVGTKQHHVFILENGKLKEIPVTMGANNGSLTEIEGGAIKPGMAVVVDTLSVAI